MPARLTKLPLWQPLRDGLFRRLFLGESLAVLADQMFLVALTLMVLRIAGTGAELGAVLAVASIPGAIFMLVGGLVADRFPPAAVLVVSNAGRALLMGVLAWIVFSDAVQMWHLYTLAGALGLLDAFHYPASLSVVPSVVGEERLGAANALVQGAEQVGGLVGPALAAASVALLGLGTTFGVFALMFLATSAVIFSVARNTRWNATRSRMENAASATIAAGPAGAGGGILEGIRYAWGDPVIRAVLLVLAAINVAAIGPIMVGGAVLAEERLGGAASLGVLLSGFGGGALIGLLAAGFAGRPKRRGAKLLGVSAMLGVGLAALGFVPGLLSASAVTVAMGVGEGYLGVVLVSWLQERTVPCLRGRVMSLVVFCAVALDPVSYALAGVLVGVDLTLTFVAAGTLMLAAALLGFASRKVRSFD